MISVACVSVLAFTLVGHLRFTMFQYKIISSRRPRVRRRRLAAAQYLYEHIDDSWESPI